MDPFKGFTRWMEARQTHSTPELPDGDVDIITLSERRLIGIQATGDSIIQTQASITSRVKTSLKILISPGTYFVSPGTFQNMVVRREYEFELRPRATQHISVATSCMNPRLPVPNSADKFVGVALAQEELCRFLRSAVHENLMTVQAGVWAVTSGYTPDMIKNRLRSPITRTQVDPEFPPPTAGALRRGAPAITDEQIERAAYLLDRLGIKHQLEARVEALVACA